MKFLVPNYSYLQNPWLRGYRPQIPVLSVLCPQMNLLNPPRKKFLGTPLVRVNFKSDLMHCTLRAIIVLYVLIPINCTVKNQNYILKYPCLIFYKCGPFTAIFRESFTLNFYRIKVLLDRRWPHRWRCLDATTLA